MNQVYDDEAWDARCQQMWQIAGEVGRDMQSLTLAELAGDDTGPWNAKIYGRLEGMPAKDLALIVVLLLHEETTFDATRMWSALHTMTPEDVS